MSDLKVYIRPFFRGKDRGEGGIRRWVEAQHRYLPEYGIEPVGREGAADLVACHAGDLVNTPKPLVAHNHGLYNTAHQGWSKWEWMLNQNVIEVMRRAKIITVPSSWVANQVARGLCAAPRVLYAGITTDEWEPGENGKYVLWNKTRVDSICDPTPLNRLAAMNPIMRFVSTFGDKQANIKLTGRLPYGKAKELIRNAGVYLCTAKETFGIGTLEAMACGVPILGWAWGGQLDIINHGEMGYLAKPGDLQELQHGLELCIENRDEWGAAGREHVLANFGWEHGISHCAKIYRDAYAMQGTGPKVTVLVTVYDLEQYLPACLDSVASQTMGDWECLIVDDCSPGPCEQISKQYTQRDPRFRYIRTPQNLYLAGARNYGIAHAKGEYIIPLDCDDMLGERALALLSNHLDQNPGIHVTYGAMQVIEPDGSEFVSGWPVPFNWNAQMIHRNQLPYSSMYRKEAIVRTGGYRERCPTAEDADLWCRVSSFGVRPAKATNYPCLIYRNRADSMSHVVADIDWTAWYPWAHRRSITPFGAVGAPPNEMSWPVRTFDDPDVSVVIPVGPGHERLVIDALDSVLAQAFDNWEVVVVNDTGHPLHLPGHPWARIVETPEPGSGPAVGRNVGIAAARAPMIALLDADDYYMPHFLDRAMAAWREHGGFIYTDWYQINADGTSEHKEAPDWNIMDLLYEGLKFTTTVLFEKGAWALVGGYDPDSGGWEDWDFFFALSTEEFCGTHLPEPLFVYRYWSGQRREDGYATSEETTKKLREKWAEYVVNKGAKLMGCRSCRKGGGGRIAARSTPSPASRQVSSLQVNNQTAADSGMVLLRYVGRSVGTRTYRGPKSRQSYRAGGNPSHREIYVWGVDAPDMVALPDFDYVHEGPGDPLPDQLPSESPVLATRQAPNRVNGDILQRPEEAIELAPKSPVAVEAPRDEIPMDDRPARQVKPGEEAPPSNGRLKVTCADCGYEWTTRRAVLPQRCANPECRSKAWRGTLVGVAG